MGFLGLRERRLACSSTSTIQNLMASDNDFICLAHHSAVWVGHNGYISLHLVSSEVAQYCCSWSHLLAISLRTGGWWLMAMTEPRYIASPSDTCLLGPHVMRETGPSVSPSVIWSWSCPFCHTGFQAVMKL